MVRVRILVNVSIRVKKQLYARYLCSRAHSAFAATRRSTRDDRVSFIQYSQEMHARQPNRLLSTTGDAQTIANLMS